jgi:hypothetical protein
VFFSWSVVSVRTTTESDRVSFHSSLNSYRIFQCRGRGTEAEVEVALKLQMSLFLLSEDVVVQVLQDWLLSYLDTGDWGALTSLDSALTNHQLRGHYLSLLPKLYNTNWNSNSFFEDRRDLSTNILTWIVNKNIRLFDVIELDYEVFTRLIDHCDGLIKSGNKINTFYHIGDLTLKKKSRSNVQDMSIYKILPALFPRLINVSLSGDSILDSYEDNEVLFLTSFNRDSISYLSFSRVEFLSDHLLENIFQHQRQSLLSITLQLHSPVLEPILLSNHYPLLEEIMLILYNRENDDTNMWEVVDVSNILLKFFLRYRMLITIRLNISITNFDANIVSTLLSAGYWENIRNLELVYPGIPHVVVPLIFASCPAIRRLIVNGIRFSKKIINNTPYSILLIHYMHNIDLIKAFYNSLPFPLSELKMQTSPGLRLFGEDKIALYRMIYTHGHGIKALIT